MKLKRPNKKAPQRPLSSLLNEAIAHQRRGDVRQAEALYRYILGRAPEHPEANNNLGILLHQRGEVAAARVCYERALRGNPSHREARKNLAIALKDTGDPERAIQLLTEVLAAAPGDIDALNSLALAHRAMGRHREAEACLRRAEGTDRYAPTTLINLANTLHDLGKNGEAEEKYRLALTLAGDNPVFRFNYANFLRETNRSGAALPILENLVAAQPSFTPPYEPLAGILLDLGDIDRALHLLQCSARQSATPSSMSAAIACTNYAPGRAQSDLLDCARDWDKTLVGGCGAGTERPRASRRKDGRIGLGFLSPDFRDHPVSYFLRPVLEQLDRAKFSIHCYASTTTRDDFSEALRDLTHGWRDIATSDDSTVAALIRADKIDILIDLAGHSAGNRLPVFAMAPAPVQVNWLGYPNSTGLSAMDARLTDPWADPPEEGNAHATECLVRLPESFFCFPPPAGCPPIPPLPADRNGYITFGSVNNLRKLNRTVLTTWSALLTAVPTSRLTIICHQFHDPLFTGRIADFFAGRGIDAHRLSLRASLPREAYFTELGEMDIGLDSFPLCGHTVTLQQLWMGVPVVTLRGERFGGRMGASVLQQCGHPELIAESQENYVKIAAELAADRPRLRAMRQGMRQAFGNAPFADAVGFTRAFEKTLVRILKEAEREGCLRRR